VIRVLIASHSSALENAIRSSASMEFAGRVSLSALDLPGDVLLIETDESSDYDWRELAELPVPTLLLLREHDPALVSAALRAGICGAIPSDATPPEIEAAVQAVHAGLIVTAPGLLPRDPAVDEELAEPLSGRELEVLDLLAEGLPNKLIAHRLNISEHTVKTHVASIFAKLRVSSRTEAVSQAIRRGWVML
jgi:two-component system, NarL family, response regulator YdfI